MVSKQWFEREHAQKALQGIKEAIFQPKPQADLGPDLPVARVDLGLGACYETLDGTWILLQEDEAYCFGPETELARVAGKALVKQGCNGLCCGSVPTPEELRLIQHSLRRHAEHAMPVALRAYASEPTCCQRAEDLRKDECPKCGARIHLAGDGRRAG